MQRKRDKLCRGKTNAGDGAIVRRPSSNEAGDTYERICVDVVYHEEYTAVSARNDQEDGYEIPVN